MLSLANLSFVLTLKSLKKMNTIICVITSLVIVACIVLMGLKTNMLKDDSTAKIKPFSFARVQLAWWTTIIMCSFVYIIMSKTGWTEAFAGDPAMICNIVSQSALVLLGIGASTTAAGRIIDNSQSASSRHQNDESEGLMLDILSDANGVSIHRFQSVVFNIIFGIMFIVKVYNNVHSSNVCISMPDFNSMDLGLLGLSSAAYAALKIGENTTKNQAQG